MEPEKSGNSPRSGPKIVYTVSEERALQIVLNQMMASSVRRILNSANSTESSTEGCVRCSED